jgi:hypothetical protein
VILMYIKNIKWLNYLRSIDKWHFDSLEKTTLPPLARHLFSAVKDIMVNTLSESTMFLLTYYRKSLSHISFFLVSCRLLVHFSTIYNALEVRPDINKPKKNPFLSSVLNQKHQINTLETSLNPFIVLSYHLISPKMKYQPRF